MKRPTPSDIDDLYRIILRLENLDDARRFFRDLLTEYEIAEFAERWKAARMLADGSSYAEIVRTTGLSTRTIARVGRWLKQGRGGYTQMLQRSRR